MATKKIKEATPEVKKVKRVKASDYIRKDELGEFLKDRLELRISDSTSFTDPNRRDVELVFENKVISKAYFNVRQTREYEG